MVRRDDDGPGIRLLAPTSGRGSPREYGATQSLIESGVTRDLTTYGSVKPLPTEPSNGVTLTWHDVSVFVPSKKSKTLFSGCRGNAKPFRRVLNNVYGAVLAGNLVAVMGSSGSGKSTLMTTLAQRNPGEVMVDADIQYNGRPLTRDMQRMAGFVYQDDLFVGSLTVREHLEFAARLKMDRHTTAGERRARIETIMFDLGLKKSEHTRIGVPGQKKSLSGGERKRLAFAAEILTDPPLLFCDEPTTGLDSYNAERIVSMLKEMAFRGKTILCTIHQPSSNLFSMFDQLMFLCEGRLAYMGSASSAAKFFASMNLVCPATYNAADFYINCLAVPPGQEAASRDRIKTICDNFSVSPYAKDISVTAQYHEAVALSRTQTLRYDDHTYARSTVRRAQWFIQLYWLTWRAFLDSVRNPAVHWIRIIQKIGIGLMVGLCFSNLHYDQLGVQNLQGLMFVLVTENTFPAMYGVLSLFPQELPLFLRENKSGMYSTACFYISRVISLIPGFVLDPVIFISLIYFLTSLRSDFQSVFMMYLIGVFTCNTAAACGCFFSAAFDNVSQAIALLIPFDYLLMITGGIFINLSTMPKWLSWTKSLSWFMYANEAFTIIQWSGIENIPCQEASNSSACLRSGEEVLNKYSFHSGDLGVDFSGFILLFLCFHVLGIIALWLRSRKQ
ncbi:protein scarlet-like isoform X2 [Pollicipes pollicipes]|uniref:protein scarlet-like isoform X2 n=1 Tax=Pollicipes pollicipes TaxID=41117 RepID=UPI00188544CF|nr:protein scarlet-like isoform X2 [Pollicipes pollicipes]